MPQPQTIRQYIKEVLQSYADDPADSDFQRGYQELAENILVCLDKGEIKE